MKLGTRSKILKIRYAVIIIVLGGSLSQIFAQSITLLSPNGEESWQANSTKVIKWESQGVNNVKLEYSLDNGLSWAVIVPSVEASVKEYEWLVADVTTPYVLIRISDVLNPFVYDISDENFSIVIEEKTNRFNKSAEASGTTIKIMPLGDSITWGTNPDNSNSSGYRRSLYLQLTNAGYNVDFVGGLNGGLPQDFDRDNEGHGGWKAYSPPNEGEASLLDSLNEFLSNNPPDIILLHIGTNDLGGNNADELASEVKDLLDVIYDFDHAITIFITKIIDRADYESNHIETKDFNDYKLPNMINSLPATQQEKIILIDMYNALGQYWNNFSNPNFTYQAGSNLHTLHPNITGYEVMADTWFNSLQNYYQPVLSSPTNDALGVSPNANLSWNTPPASSAMSVVYNLQVATDTAFSNMVLDSSNISSNFITASGLMYGTKYYWRVRIPGYGWSATWNFTTESMLASIKIFLEGPYASNGTMNSILNMKGLIPTSQPYNDSPWNYTGTENVESVPPETVDWVLVELRKTDTTIIKTRAAFLKSDGTITDLDGTNFIGFNDILPDSYYVAVKHRNHLSVMSAFPVILINNTLTYDFTTDSSRFYGGSSGAKELEAGSTNVWGMMASDGNSDGLINTLDLDLTWRPENGFDEYLKGDYNLDGYVNAIDKNFFWRSNNGLDSQVK